MGFYTPFNIQPVEAEPAVVLPAAKCQHLGSKRSCCDSLFLCRKHPGESCCLTSQQMPEGVLRCDSCADFSTEFSTAVNEERQGVGFLSAAYMGIGGTETFHRTLLPRLGKVCSVAGFVSTAFHGGDGTLLEVPYAAGVEAAQQLAADCGVIVAWGISDLKSILPVNRPKVIAVHHSDLSSDWGNQLILHQLDTIDEIICVNEEVAQYFSQTCGKPVHHIPNAIDPDRIRPSGQQAALRSQYGIPAESKIVLFGHRLSAEKRPLLAVEIARHLPHGWMMVIVGDGHEKTKVEQAAAGVDQIRVIGRADSLADWLSLSSCFLSLSLFEGFGLAIGEALAAGVPTVSTPTGIASGRAITLPSDCTTATEWADAITHASSIVTPAAILDQFSVERMVSVWSSVIRRNLLTVKKS